MLNLAQTHQEVKQINSASLILNTRNLTAYNEAIKQLKALGWTSRMELHPTDRVPVFRLGHASIRRNKADGGWLVEIDGEEWETEGTIADITAHVRQLLASQPRLVKTDPGCFIVADPSPAAEIAAELTRQHGKLGGRIERALALVEAGTVEFPHYNTRVEEATGVSDCDCEDRAKWIDSGNTLGILTFFNGKGCKHCLARNIVYQLKHQQEMTAYRKQADRIERRATALPASVDNRDRLEDMLGYDGGSWGGQKEGSVADQVAAARSAVPALKSQQPKARIGSLPLAWQVR